MKYLFVIITALLLSSAVYSQVRVNVNIGSHPVWGPPGNSYVENYYLPDIEVYYNVPLHRFYYFDGGRWIWRSSLPFRYRDYDLYRAHKIVINDHQPWRNHVVYRDRYSVRRDNHWIQQPKHDNGKHNGLHKDNNGNSRGNDNGHGNNNGKGNDRGHDNG
jgi:hypothetical protein